MWWKRLTSILISVLLLSAPSCNNSQSIAKIGQMAVSTDVNLNNSPVSEMKTVVSIAPKIYASVEVVGGARGDSIQVVWENKTEGRIIETELFEGRHSASRPHEFEGGKFPITSWLASIITLEDYSWPTGEYIVTATLNGASERSAFFEVVTESDYDQKNKEKMIKNITFGTEINSRNQVVSKAENFARTDENIYASVLFQDVPEGTQMKANWKSLETGEGLSNFVQDYAGSGYLAFKLGLDEVGRTVWLRGNYVFQLFVDNTLVITKNFTIS
ncbi:MAG: hypothetical protein U9M89_03310 [Patescibacteria group bacterium]|nr:hypothetical protein [Patescibacteria group bacterium]